MKTALTKLKKHCHLKSSGASASQARSRASIHGISYRYIAGEPGALRRPIWPVAKLLPHVWEAVSVCARLDAGVSEIPAWSFLDAIPMATRCGALDAVALADFSTAKTKTNAIAPQCVGGMGLQGALAQKGMTVVAENPIEAAEVQLAILKVLRSA